MRLECTSHDHPLRKRLIHRVIRRVSGEPPPDVVLTLHHRPRFFGDAFSDWVQHALRGSSTWTEGECELMAALVSARNQCVF
jgi:hypothetical protein